MTESTRRLLATPSLLLMLVTGPIHAADSSIVEAQWKRISGDLVLRENVQTVETNAPLILEGTPLANAVQMNARIRLRTDKIPNASARFSFAGLSFSLTASSKSETISCSVHQNGKPLHDVAALTEKLDWAAQVSNGFEYQLRAYSNTLYDVFLPATPEDFRRRVEADMARLPDHNNKWLNVRVELRDGHVRFWLDDRLVAHKEDVGIKAEGVVRVELSSGTQIATCNVSELGETTKGFLTVRLEDYANARAFLGKASLNPPSKTTIRVDGVPFLFSGVNAEGNDHIDVGKSLFRQANSDEYTPTFYQPWVGSAWRDPARIQLRVPNGQYDFLHLLAASDNDGDEIPMVTAMFYRPSSGFSEQFEATVPLATAKSRVTTPLPVTMSNGRKANLWLVKIPLDPGRLSSFADMDIVEIEITKKVYPFRSYPDPIQGGWHQGGRASAVHVYALTLGEVPVGFDLSADRFGHVWTAPEVPSYTISLTNHTGSAQSGTITLVTRSYDGAEETRQEKPIDLEKGVASRITTAIPVKLNGYHNISATLEIAGKTWTEKRSFARLAFDRRAVRWTEGKGALFGFWSYHGSAHHSPKADVSFNVMTLAGARTSLCYAFGLPQHPSHGRPSPTNELILKHWAPISGAPEGIPQAWAKENPIDPKKYEAYQKEITAPQAWKEWIPEKLRPDFMAIFGEPHISNRLTSGNYPEYWGEPPYQWTDEEKERIRFHAITARCIAEAIRKTSPQLKILFPYADPLYIVPHLRSGFPRELIDGIGIDSANFCHLPEQQLHQASLHRLYVARKEFEKYGMPNAQFYYTEGVFIPTEPGMCSWREQMDLYDRCALLSMAYGVQRFYSGWPDFDLCAWYGAEQYGGNGVHRRIPYCDPKPAYAAFATMTDQLDQANFDGWLKTGSLSTYCLRFKGPRGNVYTLWTLRGKRPVTLTLAADAEVGVTDTMNNTKQIRSKDGKVGIMTDASVTYVTGGEVVSVEVGEPNHADTRPAQGAVLAADAGDGSWKYTSQRDPTYENNNFDTFRYLGKFSTSLAEDTTYPSPNLSPNPESFRGKRGSGKTWEAVSDGRTSSSSPLGPLGGEDKGEGSRSGAKVLISKLEKQSKVHELMPWYNTLMPRKPITLKGAPSHIGIWVKGASDWGRVVYCLRDAKGERWISIGTKDQWNCDDMHSWSRFNFDGWRYLRFEMPGHLGGDSFRRLGTTWWGSHDGDGVVDLPLKLETIVVEQRSHILYVNDVQPVPSDTVCFGKVYVEYETREDFTDDAVRISRLRMPLPEVATGLPNLIQELAKNGVGQPGEITRFQTAKWAAWVVPGSQWHVHVKPNARGRELLPVDERA